MVMEKKLWALPFRRPSNQDPPKAKIGRSGSRVSSVYLSDDSSGSGFVIVPEFDEPARITPEDSNSGSIDTSKCPTATSSSCHRNSYFPDIISVGSKISPYYHDHDPGDDLERRLGSAYERIRVMSSPVSPRVVLSSDPQMLRKQLGVPQHSVLNYPIGSSLDLPNPYPSPPPSPRLPPSSPPLRKPALRIRTNVNFLTSRRSAPAQGTSAATGEVPAESFSSQQDAPSDSSTSLTDNQRLPIRLPKFARRRRESHPPSSSLPFSAWQPLNILKKPRANCSPPIHEQKRQTSLRLPQIRSPSPFRVDIPLHHSWHERRTKFGFSSDAASVQPKVRRTSGSTNVLASLAWIGTPPMISGNIVSPKDRLEGNVDSLTDCTDLSVAIAVDDEDISDDVLVDRLERIRRIDDQSAGECEDLPFWKSLVDPCSPHVGRLTSSPTDQSPPPHLLQHTEFNDTPPLRVKPKVTVTTPDSEDTVVWESARKALLCIREIVRTEKRYQEALRMLLNAQTATPPPPSMSPYVLALVRTSEMLLKGFLEDPSAWGVSTAFVTCEDELEATMVPWCAVAGTFFVDCNDTQPGRFAGRWRLRKPVVPSAITSTPSSSPATIKAPSPLLGSQLPPVLPLFHTPSGKFGERIEEEQYPAPDPETDLDVQAAVPSYKQEVTKDQATPDQPPRRKLSVRDLAIQPIQRIMRYVLLYRDLLHCTPSTCPSHLLVERALEAAVRISNRCDRAQSNPAFCLAS